MIAAPASGLLAVGSYSLVSAALGAVIWAVALGLLKPGWEAALLLLAPLVLVPLGFVLLLGDLPLRTVPPVGQAAIVVQLPAALLLVFAVVPEPGLWAGLLALPWMLTTWLVAGLGLVRLRQYGKLGPEAIAADVGLVFLAIGGVWVVLSRSGTQPMGFKEPIILLTGVHFHYAGFVLPILTSLAGQALRSHSARLACLLVCIAVPLVALGITLTPQGIHIVEWLASWLMATAGLLVTGLQLQLAGRATHWVARLLFVVSGLSLAGGMVLAAVYALGTYWGHHWLTIPDMLPWHGGLNALGFAVPGLLAWLLESQSSTRPAAKPDDLAP